MSYHPGAGLRNGIRLSDGAPPMGGGSFRWVYNFDGIDDYVSLSISLAAGEKISVTFSNADFSISRPFFSSTLSTIIAVDGGGNFYSSNNGVDYTAELDGNVIGNFSPAPTDGGEYTLTITAINPIVVDGFGILNGGIRFFDGIAKDIIVNDGSVYNYPVDDGPGTNSIRNLGAGPDASSVNFNDERWMKVNV